MMDKLNVTRRVTEWNTLVNVVTDPIARAWVVDGLQHGWYDRHIGRMVAMVGLTVDQWWGIIGDVNVCVHDTECDTDVVRLYRVRDTIEHVLKRGGMMNKLSITRNVREWDLLADVVSDGVAGTWILYGTQHGWHDTISHQTVAIVTLTIDQWRGIVNDIHGSNVSQLRCIRNAIKSVLHNGFGG